MLPIFDDTSYWYLLAALLDWLKIFTATYLGFWLVRNYETRARVRSSRQVLQRRVEELEQVTAALEVQMQQVVEADRFASALLLKPGGERKQRVDESPH
jgi:uncharacterized protein (DUF58 family)